MLCTLKRACKIGLIAIQVPYLLPLKMAVHIQKYVEIITQKLPADDVTCTPSIKIHYCTSTIVERGAKVENWK